MAIPVPTVDQITGKTVMQKIRALITNYLEFAQDVADNIDAIETTQIQSITSSINETNISIEFTFKDESTQTIILPTAGIVEGTYKTGLLSLSDYNKIKASLNDVAYSSTAQTFSISFTDNSGQSESINIPIVGTVAGILTPEMYNNIMNTISRVYVYKGTVADYSGLPTTGNNVGDVWNVENAYGSIPAGTNYSWDGTTWDALGGSIDLSSYVTNGQMQSALSDKVNSTGWGTTNEGKYLGVSSTGEIILITPSPPSPPVEQTLAGFIEIPVTGATPYASNSPKYNAPTFISGTRVGGNISCAYTPGSVNGTATHLSMVSATIDLRTLVGTASGPCTIKFIPKTVRSGVSMYAVESTRYATITDGILSYSYFYCLTTGTSNNTFSILITDMLFTPI